MYRFNTLPKIMAKRKNDDIIIPSNCNIQNQKYNYNIKNTGFDIDIETNLKKLHFLGVTLNLRKVHIKHIEKLND